MILNTKLFILFLIILLNPTARGAITITGFDRQTFSSGEGRLLNNNNNNNTNAHIIYGGYSGICKASGSRNDSVCNSCENNRFPCNRRRIHDNLILSIYFRTTETGPILITTDSDDNQVSLENVFGPEGDVLANSEFRIGIRWQQICQQIFDGASCNDNENLNTATVGIRLGIDSNRDGKFHSNNSTEYSTDVRLAVLKINHENEDCNNNPNNQLCNDNIVPLCFYHSTGDLTGACNFSIYPGDEKVYVEDIRGSCNFPSVGNSQAEAIRVFYGSSPDKIMSSSMDLPIEGNNSNCSENNTKIITTTQNQVDGLTNGKEYFFRIGIVDKAKNVGFVTQQSNSNNCFHKHREERVGCHSAVPTEVIGLIEDEFDCFITTAIYGTSFHPKVKTFRRFRNRFLKTNKPGRLIIKIYYHYSPLVVEWITEYPRSRILWKPLLWPLWLFAKICLDWFFQALSVLLLLLFLFFINGKKNLLKIKS